MAKELTDNEELAKNKRTIADDIKDFNLIYQEWRAKYLGELDTLFNDT
jgi:hypothetical protein